MQYKFSKKFYIILALALMLAFASKAIASLTFTTNAITGTAASIIDVGSGNALSLQTTNNGNIITGSGNFGIGLTPAQKLDVAGKIATNGTTVVYQPTAFTGTLVLGNGGTNLTSVSEEDGFYDIFIGLGTATANTAGNYSVVVGSQSFVNNTTGNANTALGAYTLVNNISGSNNTAVGQQAMYSNTGSSNTALGDTALYAITSGASNVGLGFSAGRYIANGSTANQTSGTSVYLGASTKSLASGDANEIVIGYNAIGLGSNTAILGNSSITTTALRGNVGIGITSPNANAILDVTSTTKAFMPPRMTTTQRDAIPSPTAGMVIYNSSTNKLNVYTTTWEAVTSS